VRRHLLLGAAIGAALSSIAFFATDFVKREEKPLSSKIRLYELGYQRPRSPSASDFKGVLDPFGQLLPSQGLTQLAATCGVRKYKLDGMVSNGSAYLYMDPATISDETFNCLSEHLRFPYLTLHIFERCRSLMYKSPANPPCREPLP